MNESNIIDLPKLKSITSEGYSLWSPQIVEMESMKIEIDNNSIRYSKLWNSEIIRFIEVCK